MAKGKKRDRKKKKDNRYFDDDPNTAMEFVKGDPQDKTIVKDENGKIITMKELIASY